MYPHHDFVISAMMAAKILLWFAGVVSLANAFMLIHDNRRNVVKTLSVDNGAGWGVWHAPAFCAEGSYAVRYYMKVRILRLAMFKAAYSVTFDLLILKIMFLFFKNTVKILKFR